MARQTEQARPLAAEGVDYCARFGFDAQGRQHRLELLELDERDGPLARRLHEAVIAPRVDMLVERFYDYQQRFPEIMRSIGNQDNLVHLKQTQRRYLLSLGQDFSSASYFADRLRVGAVHAVRNIPLSLYQASYRFLQQLLIETAATLALQDFAAVSRFILKITALDMSLAIETYHSSQLEELRASVDRLQHEHSDLSARVDRDALTGLANREAVAAELAQALEIGERRCA